MNKQKKKTYMQVYLINMKYLMKIIYQIYAEICSLISEILTIIPC